MRVSNFYRTGLGLCFGLVELFLSISPESFTFLKRLKMLSAR